VARRLSEGQEFHVTCTLQPSPFQVPHRVGISFPYVGVGYDSGLAEIFDVRTGMFGVQFNNSFIFLSLPSICFGFERVFAQI
jgi:hypothetical protein